MEKKIKNAVMSMREEEEHKKWHKEHEGITQAEHEAHTRKMGIPKEQHEEWHKKLGATPVVKAKPKKSP